MLVSGISHTCQILVKYWSNGGGSGLLLSGTSYTFRAPCARAGRPDPGARASSEPARSPPGTSNTGQILENNWSNAGQMASLGERESEGEGEREEERERERETERQRDKRETETERQRQRDRETETERMRAPARATTPQGTPNARHGAHTGRAHTHGPRAHGPRAHGPRAHTRAARTRAARTRAARTHGLRAQTQAARARATSTVQ